jgi:hypothetical protein
MSQASIALPTGRARTEATEETVDSRYGPLYRAAGLAALATAVLIPLQIVAFIVWPLPEGGVAEWFELFNRAPFIGLVSFDLAILLEEALLIPIIAALFVLLRRASPSLMVVAALAWLVSVALFVGANTGFEMLGLAHRYAEATGAERGMYLAAGQAMLSAYMEQGSSFVVGYSLASVAGILVGVAMLRTATFPRLAGWAAIVANAIGFGLFIPQIGVVLSILSVAILIIWYAATAWGLLRLRVT